MSIWQFLALPRRLCYPTARHEHQPATHRGRSRLLLGPGLSDGRCRNRRPRPWPGLDPAAGGVPLAAPDPPRGEVDRGAWQTPGPFFFGPPGHPSLRRCFHRVLVCGYSLRTGAERAARAARASGTGAAARESPARGRRRSARVEEPIRQVRPAPGLGPGALLAPGGSGCRRLARFARTAGPGSRPPTRGVRPPGGVSDRTSAGRSPGGG